MARARGKVIGVNDFSPYLRALLDEYGKECLSVTISAADDVSREASHKLAINEKGAYTDRRGKYTRSWRAELRKTNTGVLATVYNKTEYRLTHLLENGHDVKNRKGGPVVGSAKPHPHIADVEEWAIEQFELEVAARIEGIHIRR